MKVKPHLVSVFVRCRYGLDEGTVFFETDYGKAGGPFLSAVIDLVPSVWNELVPVEAETCREGSEVPILVERQWALELKTIGSGGVSFSIKVPKEEYRQFETYFSKDQYIYLEIVPGEGYTVLSREEYDRKVEAQKEARLKRIKKDYENRKKERAKSKGPVAGSDKTVEVIHIG
ncbi:MAG: hypothetical protein HGA33_02885 [Candidatus Moranbacteria bacterium]|nr:hypothetical protein [Candidatus Moranbacteria bacterium]